MLEGVPQSLIEYVEEDNSGAQSAGWVVPFKDGVLVGVPRLGELALRILDAMYRGAAAMANGGTPVILDDVIYDRRVLSLAAEALRTTPTLFVGVRCPVEAAVERERSRGDRAPGGAVVFDRAVHSPGIYDVEVDTSIEDPDQCAAIILEAAATADGPSKALAKASSCTE